MTPHRRQLLLASALVLIFLLHLIPGSDAARESDIKYQVQEIDGKQWDMNFPYLLMMMSNGNMLVPSLWLVPVVIASCVMLFIRGTMNWI